MAKNRFFLAGILGIALVFGFAGCNDDSGGGGGESPATLDGTWNKNDSSGATFSYSDGSKIARFKLGGLDKLSNKLTLDGTNATISTTTFTMSISGNQLTVGGLSGTSTIDLNVDLSQFNGTYTKQP